MPTTGKTSPALTRFLRLSQCKTAPEMRQFLSLKRDAFLRIGIPLQAMLERGPVGSMPEAWFSENRIHPDQVRAGFFGIIAPSGTPRSYL